MKITFFSFFLAYTFCISNMSAQLDIKINPFGLLFNSPNVTTEYIINEQLGVEFLAGIDYGTLLGSGYLSQSSRLDKSGYRFRLSGKYYFNQNKGGDTWYAGLYGGVNSRSTSPSADATTAIGWTEFQITTGIHGGYKFVLNSNIIFEFGMGFGRSFSERRIVINRGSRNLLSSYALNSFLKLEMGYRF